MIGELGRSNIMNILLEKIAKIWPGVQNIFSVPHNQKKYNRNESLLG